MLFYGPPETRKTLLMKTLAEKLGLSEPLIIRGPEIISQYYGKSEQREMLFMYSRQLFFLMW
ncbi:MAG: AAA family ATPase [Caldisphaeraceae archaeon]|nr:AAA family ATPase [Caldisphaeraceae archaeon]